MSTDGTSAEPRPSPFRVVEDSGRGRPTADGRARGTEEADELPEAVVLDVAVRLKTLLLSVRQRHGLSEQEAAAVVATGGCLAALAAKVPRDALATARAALDALPP